MDYYKIRLLKSAVRKGLKTTLSQFYYIARDYLWRICHQRVYTIESSQRDSLPTLTVDGFSEHIYDSWEEIPVAYRNVLQDKNKGIWWDSQEWLSKNIRLWLGTIDDKPAVLSYLCTGNQVRNFYFQMSKKCLFVRFVYVLPEYRGRKLMSLLLTHIVHKSFNDDFECVCCITDEYNIPSRNSIERVGFRLIGNGITKRRTGRRIWFPKLEETQEQQVNQEQLPLGTVKSIEPEIITTRTTN